MHPNRQHSVPRRMYFVALLLWLLAGRVAGNDPLASDPVVPAKDLFGDPLPEGAIARLGTSRFFTVGFIDSHSVSSDGNMTLTISGDHTVHCRETTTGKLLNSYTIPHDWSRGVSHDASTILHVSKNGDIRICDARMGQHRQTVRGKGKPLSDIVASRSGRFLATVDQEQKLAIWDWTKRTILHEERIDNLKRKRHAFSHDDGLLVLGTDEGVECWSTAPCNRVRKVRFPNLWCLAAGNRSRLLALGSDKGSIVIVDATDFKIVHRLPRCSSGIDSMLFAPDDESLIVGLRDGPVRQIRLKDGDASELIPHAGDSACGLSWVHGTQLVVAYQRTMRIWNLRTKTEITNGFGHVQGTFGLLFTPSGERILTAGNDHAVRLWDATTGESLGSLNSDIALIDTLMTAPDEKTIAGISRLGVTIWDAADFQAIATYRKTTTDFGSRCYSPRGRILTADIRNNRTEVFRSWDLSRNKELWRRESPPAGVFNLQSSPDGLTLAHADTGSCVLVDASSGNELHLLPPMAGSHSVEDLGFSRDGSLLFRMGDAGRVEIWNVRTLTRLSTLHVLMEGKLITGALSPNNRVLALGDQAGIVYLVDPESGMVLRTFSKHLKSAARIAFSPDGTVLASGSGDGTALLWSLIPRRKPGEKPPTLKEMDKLWNDMGSGDSRIAHAAVWRLAAFPVESTAHLKRHLGTLPKPDAAAIKQAIGALGNESFARRDAAYRKLREAGIGAEPFLKRVLKDEKVEVEVKDKLTALLKLIESSPDHVRTRTAVMLLDYLGTPDACRLLRTISDGDPSVRATSEAAEALKRIQRRHAAGSK